MNIGKYSNSVHCSEFHANLINCQTCNVYYGKWTVVVTALARMAVCYYGLQPFPITTS
jgi:hypothetical protein